MTAPPQQQITPVDHHYFEWSTSKQQTNLVQPLMTHTNHKQYYQNYEEKCLIEDNQLKQNKPTITSPNNEHLRKKQKINGMSSSSLNTNDETCYPFQAELTQKIDIECGSNNANSSCQTAHTPTHHFTLSTVINVSVNGQTQKSLDILPSPLKSNDQQDLHIHPSITNLSPLISYSELNLYLKDIDLTTFDTFILPSCPNPQDYLTVDGLLNFLMSDKRYQLRHTTYPIQPMYNYPQTQYYRYPYPVNKNSFSQKISRKIFFHIAIL
jgi:hypothetical protein